VYSKPKLLIPNSDLCQAALAPDALVELSLLMPNMLSSLHTLADSLSSSSSSLIGSQIATHVLHNAPNTLESLHPLRLLEKIEPICAFELGDTPVFFQRGLAWQDASGEIVRVSVVDGEFEDADVVEEAGD
jgi:hypothetical protein